MISDKKELYTFGDGSYYKLGHGFSKDEIFPKKLITLEDVYTLDVACGSSHTLCITNEGFVYGWGSCLDGKLGLGEY